MKTADETQGEYLLIKVSLPPLGEGPPLHKHLKFTEEFEVLKGKLTINIGEKEDIFVVGQKLLVPIGMAHTFYNAHDELVEFRVKLTSASGFEQSVRIHYGLMDDGLTDGAGNPNNLCYLIKILKLQDTFLADKSIWLQQILFGIISGFGKIIGVYKLLDKYLR